MLKLFNIYSLRAFKIVKIIGLLCTFEILVSFVLSTYNPPYENILIKLDIISLSFLTFESFYKLFGARRFGHKTNIFL
ncbi:hypothetical protein ACO3VM_00295 [Methanocaldococcus sp. 10A]